MTAAPQLVREGRSQRLNQRLRTPLWVTIDGQRIQAADWSMGGFGLRLADCPWPRGAEMAVRLDYPSGSTQMGFVAPCRLVHLRPGRQGFRFVELTADQMDLLGQVWLAATTGQVVPLGAPPPPPRSEPERDQEPPAASWRRRAGYAVLLLGGLAVAVLIALSFHARFLVVRAEHAAMTVPVLRLRAPVEGRLGSAPPMAGESVPAGAPLFAIADQRLAADIQLAENELSRLAADVEALRRRRDAMRAFFADYADLAAAALRRAEAERERTRATLTLAERDLARFRDLAALGYAARARLDQAEERDLRARQDLAAAEAASEQARANLRMSRQGRWFSGSRVEGAEPAKLDEDIRRAEAAHGHQAQTLAGLIEQHAGRVVTSPCACRVAAVLAQAGEWLDAGTEVVLLQAEAVPRLTARVPQADADWLAVGDPAILRLAGTTEVETGTVVSISRLAVPDGRFGLPGLPGGERWATIEIAVAGAEALAPGMPAQVLFTIPPRRLLLRWFGW